MSARITAAAMTALAIGACATAEPKIPVRGATPGYTCTNGGLDQFVGRQATQDLGAEMLRASGSRILRWVRPGMAVTMEFSPERLTVHLDEAGRISGASCG